MSVFLQPIYTQTVGSGGAGSITFNNIPQTFTDLYILASIRSNSSNIAESLVIGFNNDTSLIYSNTAVGGDGSNAASQRQSANAYLSYNSYLVHNGNNATANTFANIGVYISNYTSSNFKSVLIDTVPENNATNVNMGLGAGLYRSTNPITSYKMIPYSGTLLLQYSSITIYGITKG